MPKDPKVPGADTTELRQTRGSAQLADDIDVKFFPHLFPDGTSGWKDAYKSFSQYAESDCWDRTVASSNPRLTSCGSWRRS